MNSNLVKSLLLVGVLVVMSSCAGSRKHPGRAGDIIVIDARHDRTGNETKDNGLHKGWYKNPNNPHHPNTTNPGHTKPKKGKAGKGANAGRGKKH